MHYIPSKARKFSMGFLGVLPEAPRDFFGVLIFVPFRSSLSLEISVCIMVTQSMREL